MKSRQSRAFRAAVFFTGFGYASQALSLIAIPIYLKYIGVEDYGLLVLVMSFVGYLNFAEGGLGWASMILIGEAHGRADQSALRATVRNSVIFALISGGMAMVLLAAILLSSYIGYRLPMFSAHAGSDRLLLIAGAYIIINIQVGVFYNLFQGLQDASWTALYQGVTRLVSVSVMILMAVITHSVYWVMASQLFVSLLIGLICILHALKKYPWILGGGAWVDSAQMQRQLRTGAKMFFLQSGRMLTATAPVMAISSVLGPASVPLYTIPTTLFQLCLMPLNMWSTSIHGAYSEAWAAGDHAWVSNAYRDTLDNGLRWIACGAAFFIPLAAPFIFFWTSGKLVLPDYMPFAVVAIGLLGWFQVAGQYLLSAINKQKKISMAEVGCGLLALAFCWASVKLMGAAGVGVGIVLAMSLISIPWTCIELKLNIRPLVFPSRVRSLTYFVLFGVVAGGGVLAARVAAYFEHSSALGNVFLIFTVCVIGLILMSNLTGLGIFGEISRRIFFRKKAL